MKRNNGEEELKEFYKLWWEYLKRSKIYLEYCEWMRGDIDQVSDELQKKQYTLGFSVHRIFGDVHTDDFETLWARRTVKGGLFYKSGSNPTISDATEYILCLFDMVERKFQGQNGRVPTIPEIRGLFQKALNEDTRFVFKKVDLYSDKSEVKIGIQKHKKDKQVYVEYNQATVGGGSLKKFKMTDLKHYLDIYDCYQNNNNNTDRVIKEIGTKEERQFVADPNNHITEDEKGKVVDIEVVRKRYRRGRLNAERIIKNAEIGQFPGKY